MTATLQPKQAVEQSQSFGPIQLVVLQATPFCNLNCDYCYLPDRQNKQRLDLNLLEPIFSQLFASPYLKRCFTVVWHAGEPLSVPIAFYESAFQIIADLNQKRTGNTVSITHSFQTNGTLITQDWCEFIQHFQVNIGVSIDGPAFLHDAHRKTRTGLGTHASALRGIQLLQKNNIPFHIIAVLTGDALAYPDEMFEFFIENGIHHVGFNIDEIEGSHATSSLDGSDAELRYRRFMERFYELTQQTPGRLCVREFDQIKHAICYGSEDPIKGQFTPFTMVNINYKGDFSTYSPELLSMTSKEYKDFILGNLLTDTLESVCQTDKFRRLHQEIQTGVEQCRATCPYFSVCGGGAPSNKYFENHSFASTETLYCRLNKKVLTDIVLKDIENILDL